MSVPKTNRPALSMVPRDEPRARYFEVVPGKLNCVVVSGTARMGTVGVFAGSPAILTPPQTRALIESLELAIAVAEREGK